MEEGLILDSRWKVGKLLGSGSYGSVHLVEYTGPETTGIPTGVEWVVKICAEHRDECEELRWEYRVYNRLRSCNASIPTIPSVELAKGLSNGYQYLILQRLGMSVLHLQLPDDNVERLKMVVKMMRQVLKTFSFVHLRGYVYRDLNLGNLVFGTGEEKGRLYLIDFGLSEQYIEGDDWRKKTLITDCVGSCATYEFAGIRVHDDEPPRPYDDVEGIMYLFIYLVNKRKLPWSGKKKEDLIKIKRKCKVATICKDMMSISERVYKLTCNMVEMLKQSNPHLAVDYEAFDTAFKSIYKAV